MRECEEKNQNLRGKKNEEKKGRERERNFEEGERRKKKRTLVELGAFLEPGLLIVTQPLLQRFILQQEVRVGSPI